MPIAIAATIARRVAADTGNGTPRSMLSSHPLNALSASAPIARLAIVMPNWLAESKWPIEPVARSAARASRSPVRAIASSRVRRDRTSENSAATKYALSSTRTTIATIRIGPECKVCFVPVMSSSGHDHSHAHGHAHDHAHDPGADHPAMARSLKIPLGITVLLLVGEAVGGWLAHSLALLAVAGHVLT